MLCTTGLDLFIDDPSKSNYNIFVVDLGQSSTDRSLARSTDLPSDRVWRSVAFIGNQTRELERARDVINGVVIRAGIGLRSKAWREKAMPTFSITVIILSSQPSQP